MFHRPFLFDAMLVIVWGVRLLLFVFLVAFALQNTSLVALQFFPGQLWQAPLVIVLVVFFALGVFVGLLSLLGLVIRQRKEIARLKHQLPAAVSDLPNAP